jgi:hypothetical protein
LSLNIFLVSSFERAIPDIITGFPVLGMYKKRNSADSKNCGQFLFTWDPFYRRIFSAIIEILQMGESILHGRTICIKINQKAVYRFKVPSWRSLVNPYFLGNLSLLSFTEPQRLLGLHSSLGHCDRSLLAFVAIVFCLAFLAALQRNHCNSQYEY